MVLITCADQVKKSGESPLRTLHHFLQQSLNEAFSHIHLLPFFPSSSDDGVAVIDYQSIDPEIGTWEDLALFGRDFKLMADLVINHVSSRSRWFQNYLKGVDPGADFFSTGQRILICTR
jgi:sucrose phosphorylase